MIPQSLTALLTNVIDYAGLYPPAALPLAKTVANYEQYRHSQYAWMLNRLVLPLGKLNEVTLKEGWRITLLVDSEPGPLPAQVETLETKGGKRLSLPTYCEVPLARVETAYAKVRTGGLTAEATPSSEDLADFLCEAAAWKLPFKATAGLHHPIRSTDHGFLNVFLAATFAWLGMGRITVINLLQETDPHAFRFRDDLLQWREWSASTPEVERVRRDFAHSFGSCSFAEPIDGLRALRLLS